ncbi:unnamed protein product [Caretta caretta]
MAHRPSGHHREEVEAATGTEGTQREFGTQTITGQVSDKGTGTEWAQQEAGTRVVMEQTTKWTQTLKVEGLGDADLRAKLEAVEQAHRKAETNPREMAKGWEAAEKKRAALEVQLRGAQGRSPPSRGGDFEGGCV